MAYIRHHRDGGGRQALPRPKSTTKNDLIAAANRAESDSLAPGARQGIPAAGGGANPSAATGPATVPGHQLPRPAEQTHARHRPPRQLDSGDLAIPPHLALKIVRAITRRSWSSSPRMFGCRRRGAAPDRVHAARHRRVFRVNGADAYNEVFCSGSPATVDRTPRGAFNRPI